MAKKPTPKKRAPRREPARDPLAGFRERDGPRNHDDDPMAEEGMIPAEYNELNVLDMAFETRNAIKDIEGPLRYVLDQAMDEATQANRALLRCDPFDSVSIRHFQDEWKRFDRLVQWVFSTLVAGKFIEQSKTAEELAEINQLLHDAGEGD